MLVLSPALYVASPLLFQLPPCLPHTLFFPEAPSDLGPQVKFPWARGDPLPGTISSLSSPADAFQPWTHQPSTRPRPPAQAMQSYGWDGPARPMFSQLPHASSARPHTPLPVSPPTHSPPCLLALSVFRLSKGSHSVTFKVPVVLSKWVDRQHLENAQVARAVT